ncbi:MAG TPA: bifunctional phosphoribosyl-AMP cyclohydrolase/phosphoribosyl-ATP diphosphatase HisIE [Candidatus Binatia bacterium]|nr:bifunctional phosphoribosyl-AMP cyclohydrolase/phosphoribosyl-ATP diphosphatase HisIE [Candidatus Binatia bacterium]
MSASPAMSQLLATVRFDEHGLVPVVVQDAVDGRVLMLAYADREAIDATVANGEVHFHSRSRGRLWRKGETSGNVLRVVDLALDCDADAVLATVEPAGPACHTGARSCFDGDAAAPPPQGLGWLEELWATIDQRATERPAGSYTAALLGGGVDATARKVAEEATEVVLAAKDDAAAEAAGLPREATARALAGEAADLVYHLLVLLAERGQAPAAVIRELRARHANTRTP